MVKTLTKHGNSLALLIDKPILELIRVDAHTHFRVTVDGRKLILEPIEPGADDKDFKAAADWTLKKYGKTFKKLAE